MDPHMFDSEFSYELYIFSILNLYLTVKHVWPIICATDAFNLQEQRRFSGNNVSFIRKFTVYAYVACIYTYLDI